MYTATLQSKSYDRVGRKIDVDVEFTDGTNTFLHKFQFPLYTTVDQIKRVVKEYADEVEQGEVLEPLIAEGAVDFASVADTPQINIDFNVWARKKNKLDKVNELIVLNVFTGNEQPIQDLVAEVKSEFQVGFLDLM